MNSRLLLIFAISALAACTATPASNDRLKRSTLSDAEIVAYNATVSADSWIYCSVETTAGSYIKQRICGTKEYFNYRKSRAASELNSANYGSRGTSISLQ